MRDLSSISLFIVASGLFLLLFACEEVVDLGIEEQQSRLVVLSNFEPDSLFKVNISKSRSALSNTPFEPIGNDAIVGIYEGDQLLEELDLQFDPLLNKDIYVSKDLKPTEGTPYTIWVKALDLPDVTGTDQIPPKVEVVSFEIFNERARFTGPGGVTIQVLLTLRVQFRDPPDERNFYHFNVYYKNVDRIITPEDTLRVETGTITDLFLADTPNRLPYLPHSRRGVLLEDERSDGELMTFEFEAISLPIGIDERPDKFFVELRSVSPSYYRYHSSLTRQSQETDTVFSEPIILFNNIKDGYGIFAGFNSSVDSFQIDR